MFHIQWVTVMRADVLSDNCYVGNISHFINEFYYESLLLMRYFHHIFRSLVFSCYLCVFFFVTHSFLCNFFVSLSLGPLSLFLSFLFSSRFFSSSLALPPVLFFLFFFLLWTSSPATPPPPHIFSSPSSQHYISLLLIRPPSPYPPFCHFTIVTWKPFLLTRFFMVISHTRRFIYYIIYWYYSAVISCNSAYILYWTTVHSGVSQRETVVMLYSSVLKAEISVISITDEKCNFTAFFSFSLFVNKLSGQDFPCHCPVESTLVRNWITKLLFYLLWRCWTWKNNHKWIYILSFFRSTAANIELVFGMRWLRYKYKTHLYILHNHRDIRNVV